MSVIPLHDEGAPRGASRPRAADVEPPILQPEREVLDPAPKSRGAGGLRVTSASEFIAEQMPALRWLVLEILLAASIGFIGGAPKVLKSWLALDLAFAVADGGMFCGRFRCPEPARVLLVQFESARAAFQRRVQLRARRGSPPEALFIVSNEAVLFEDPVAMKRVSVTLAEFRPDLLILDPLAAMTTGDENSNQEMGAVVRQLRSWRDEFGCAIAVVHHTNKGSAAAGAGMRSGLKLRGAGAFYAAAEWALWLERPDDAAPRIEIHVEQKEAEPRRPFVVEFSEADAELRVVADEISVQVTDADLLDAVVARKRRATAKEIAGDLGIPERTVRDRMTSLVGQRRAWHEAGSGRGSRALVYVVPKTASTAPRLLPEVPS